MNRRYLDRAHLREPVPANSYLAALSDGCGRWDREHPPEDPRRRTFPCGENGTGKSTLLEAVAVACGFNAEGGTRNFSSPPGRPTPHPDVLSRGLHLSAVGGGDRPGGLLGYRAPLADPAVPGGPGADDGAVVSRVVGTGPATCVRKPRVRKRYHHAKHPSF